MSLPGPAAVRGMNDVLPADIGAWQHVERVTRALFTAYGFEELRVPLVEVSLKVRLGPPVDDEADLGLPYWAGVLPVVTAAGAPVPAPELDPAVAVPDSVRRWTGARRGPR